jgi:hypothetical protein
MTLDQVVEAKVSLRAFNFRVDLGQSVAKVLARSVPLILDLRNSSSVVISSAVRTCRVVPSLVVVAGGYHSKDQVASCSAKQSSANHRRATANPLPPIPDDWHRTIRCRADATIWRRANCDYCRMRPHPDSPGPP